MKAIVVALALALGLFITPSGAQSEKEITPILVTASAAFDAKPVKVIIVTKDSVKPTVKPPVKAKKKTKKNAKKKIVPRDHHKHKAAGQHKAGGCAPHLDEGLVKLHSPKNNDYGKISPITAPYHLTAQPPCV